MELNNLSPAPGSTKARKRVGRGIGSGHGKTSGSGHKGQKSRTGGTVRPGFEGGQMPLQMRLPKFGFNSKLSRITAEVRTSELNKIEGDVVDMAALIKADVISGNYKRAKIMLSGDVSKAFTVKGVGVTKGARAAIEGAGGKIEVTEDKPKQKPAKKAAAEKSDDKKSCKKAGKKAAAPKAEARQADKTDDKDEQASE